MNKGNSASLFVSLLLILGICLALIPTTAQANDEAEKYYIPTDEDIGTWNTDKTIFTLTEDVSGEIVIDANNFTLDGNGNTVTAPEEGEGIGVDLGGKTGVTIKNLTVQKFMFGIHLRNSDNNTLEDNTVSSNDSGIYVSDSSDNDLTGNTVSENETGIYLEDSHNNTLKGNTVSNNEHGIVLGSSKNNTIYNNYFNNNANFYFMGTAYSNAWNTTKTSGTNIVGGPYLGGNFWAKPDGTGFSETAADTDGDGICDDKYSLATNNVDYLPLVVSPKVKSVRLDPPSPVGVGEVSFTITFSENMDTNTSPTVTFGTASPYDKYTIDKTNYSGNTWVGTFTIEAGYDGEQHLSISGAKNSVGSIMLPDTSHTFIVDTTPPSGSISINDGALYTNSCSVSLTLSASDSLSGVSRMTIGNTSSFQGSSWESYRTSRSWTLSSGDGEKRVYVRFKDGAGNVSRIYSDEIILDTNPPTTSLVDYPPDKVIGNTPKVVAAFTWKGSNSAGVSGMTPSEALLYQYKLEGHSSYQDWSGWSKDKTKTFLLPSGSYTFRVRAKDEAGNYPSEDDPETARYSFTVSLPIIIYPNPSSVSEGGVVTFSNLPLGSHVRVYIYDLGGSLVRVLEENDIVIEGGSKTVTWNLRNDREEMVARGIYIYHIPGATEKRTGKIAIIK